MRKTSVPTGIAGRCVREIISRAPELVKQILRERDLHRIAMAVRTKGLKVGFTRSIVEFNTSKRVDYGE